MIDQNVFCALRQGFPQDLDSVAIETADGLDAPLRYTWRDLDQMSARVANLLAALRLPVGARVVAHVEKSVEALVFYLGVLRAGFVYLPLNTAYQAAELGHFLGDAAPSVVVTASKNLAWVSELAAVAGGAHVFTLDDDRTGTLWEAAVAQPTEHQPVAKQADDLAAIIYTSGTTGRSKGAMLTHGNLLSNARVLGRYWGWDAARPDTLIHALPLFHVHGLFVAAHAALLAGAKMIWFARFDAQAVLRRLPEATVFMGVPTLYVRLLADPALGAEACRNIRLFLAGSAPLLLETFQQFRVRTGHTIVERYGMSETLMLTSNPYHAADGARRGGTVGFPLPGVELRVRDERGVSCAAGEIGGIEVRGPNVFKGYWRMPEKTAEDFTADGWFKTGDVGQCDTDGYVTLVGRSKDLVISGGFNVYPAEVEGYLNDLPGVAESAVIGVPHPDFGEAVVAILVPKAGAAIDPVAAVAALKGKIASFKLPKRCFVEESLPRNAMGKVQKNLLRERHRGLFSPP